MCRSKVWIEKGQRDEIVLPFSSAGAAALIGGASFIPLTSVPSPCGYSSELGPSAQEQTLQGSIGAARAERNREEHRKLHVSSVHKLGMSVIVAKYRNFFSSNECLHG